MTGKRLRKAISIVSSVLVALSTVCGTVPAYAEEVSWAGRVVVPGDTVTGVDELYLGDEAYTSGTRETVTDRAWKNGTPWAYMTLPIQALTVQEAPAETVGDGSTEAETAPAPQATLTAYTLQKLGMVVELEGASFPDPVDEVLMPDVVLTDENGNERTAHFVCAHFNTGDTVTVKADDAPEGMTFSEWNIIYTDPLDMQDDKVLAVTDLGVGEEAGKNPVLTFPMPTEEWILRIRPSYTEAPAETEPPAQEETAPQEELSPEEKKEFVPRAVGVSCSPEGAGSAEISLDGIVPEDQGSVRAVGGQNVTVTALPSEGYACTAITVMNTAGETVAENSDGSGALTFTMPDDDVNISVTFDVSAQTDAPAQENTEGQEIPAEDSATAQVQEETAPADGQEQTDGQVSESEAQSEVQNEVQSETQVPEEQTDGTQAQSEMQETGETPDTETAVPAESGNAQAPVYKVSFDSAGGNDIMSQAVTGGEPAGEPEAPVREGYTFGGWFADEALSVPYDFASPVYSDITLYAKWDQTETAAQAETPAPENAQTETPAVNGDGTQQEVPAETAVQEEAPVIVHEAASEEETAQTETPVPQETQAQVQEETAQEQTPETQAVTETAPAPQENGEAAQTPENQTENTDVQNTANAAEPEIQPAVSHRVSFDSTGGSEVMSQAVEDGKTAVKPEDPVRSGYVFGGWYADAELTVPYDFASAVTSDITLFAFWSEEAQQTPEENKEPENGTSPEGQGEEKTSFTVTFNSMDGPEIPPQNVEAGGTVGMPEAPSREGFTFGGWYSDEALTTQYAFDTPVTADITLYAKWDQVSATKTVTFNSNGGSEVPPQSIENGNTASWPQDPTREGFSFKGWYADEGLTVAYAFTEPVTEDITLYAKWEGNTSSAHSITVTAGQNGTVSVDRTVAAVGETVKITATPSAGYKTKSVSVKTADGTDVAVSDGTFTMPDADVTVSAEFEDDAANRQYSVTPAGSYASAISFDKTSAKAGERVTASLQNQWQKASVTWDVKDASGNAVQADAPDGGWTASFTMPASNVTVTAVVAISQAHTLTVNGGSGSGSYYEGDTVTIKADKPESGKDFSSWTSPSGNVAFGNAASAETTITMPNADASVTANYSKAMRSLTVKNGTGGGTYATGATVDISAATPEDGKQFKGWKVSSGDAKITDASRMTTSVTVGLEDSTIKATYRDCPKAEENRIEGIEDGRAYGVEQRIEFTAVGAGMDNTNPNKGDRRWLPTDYSVNTVTGKWDQAPYRTAMAIKAVGEYTVTVNFARQVYDGSQWAADGTKDSKSVKFRISETPDEDNAANGMASGGDGTGAGSQTSDGYNVKTGDRSPIGLLAGIMGVAAVVAGAVFFIIRKRRKEE